MMVVKKLFRGSEFAVFYKKTSGTATVRAAKVKGVQKEYR
jgi:hypothetical protein